MRRYSTIKLLIDLDSSTEQIKEIWLTFSRENNNRSEIFTKTINDMIKTDTGFICSLSESDTSELNHLNRKESKLFIQARVLYFDGSAATSNIVETSVDHVLKEGLIE